jgi:hypothetical protein
MLEPRSKDGNDAAVGNVRIKMVPYYVELPLIEKELLPGFVIVVLAYHIDGYEVEKSVSIL